MQISDLAPVVMVILLTGMLIGVGILTMTYFGIAAKNSNTISIGYVTLNTAYQAQLGQTDTVVLTSFGNSSVTGTVGSNVNCTSAGLIKADSNTFQNNTLLLYNVTYTYKTSTAATTAANTIVTDVLAPISSNWIGLIVTIAILSIVLGIVVNSFAFGKGRS